MYLLLRRGGWMAWFLDFLCHGAGRGCRGGGGRSGANLDTYDLLVDPLLLDDEFIVELVRGGGGLGG